EAKHLRQRERHLVALVRLVVDERDGFEADVEVLRDPLDRAALRTPMDLRVEEVLEEAELAQLRERRPPVVAARDRMQDAASVERLDRFADPGPEAYLRVFEEDSVPDRVIEIPD